MITCPKCTKENQDHYKFCLGCGAELPRDASPKKFAPGTPPHGVPPSRAAKDEPTDVGQVPEALAQPAPLAPPPAKAAPVAAAAYQPSAGPAPSSHVGGATVVCPQCDHANPPTNKFCASCGFKISKPLSVPAPPIAAPAAAATGAVLTALRADGTEAGTYTLPGGTITIGRDTGAVFAGDSYLSPRHATFTPRGGKLFVRDESSLNGVYRKLTRDEPVACSFGDVFRIGQELLRFEALAPLPASADGVERMGSPSKGYIGRVALIIGRDATGNAYPIPETGLHLGRERGDVLFPEDGYVSGLHCRIAIENGKLSITDLGSSNGSFIRLMTESEVHNGDVLLMGQQLFRVNM